MSTHIAYNMRWLKDEHFDDDVLRHPIEFDKMNLDLQHNEEMSD